MPVPVRAEVLLDVNPTEVEFGGRPEDVVCVPRRLDELEYQCQPRDEPDDRLHGCCCGAVLPRSMMSRTGAGCGAGHSVRAGIM